MNLSLTLSTSPGTYYSNNTFVLNPKAVYNIMAADYVGTGTDKAQFLIR
jgi:hypothetical protein